MKILVVGSGSREHSIVWKLAASASNHDIYCAPGNGGTALLAQNLDMKATTEQECDLLAGWAFNNRIELVIVGPELPLRHGLADSLKLLAVPVMGPTQAASRIEWSKVWAREFMARHDIPSPKFWVVEGTENIAAHLASSEASYPLVVKADGLAGGKGAMVAADREAALEAVREMKITGALPADDNATRVVLEEFLEGVEVSVLAFTDGVRIAMMPPVCDYKRLLDGDEGPMTGGMGAYAPTSLVGDELHQFIQKEVIEKAVAGLAAEGTPFSGVLYAGLMLTADGPKVLEFNSRLGDPETQVLLPMLETPLEDVAHAIALGDLGRVGEIRWSEDAVIGVVVAAETYPITASAPVPVTGLSDVEDGVLLFHGGTELRGMLSIKPDTASKPKSGGFFKSLFGDDQPGMLSSFDPELFTSGGRVITLVARGANFREARERTYRNIERIRFQGAQYRRDIAAREVKE